MVTERTAFFAGSTMTATVDGAVVLPPCGTRVVVAGQLVGVVAGCQLVIDAEGLAARVDLVPPLAEPNPPAADEPGLDWRCPSCGLPATSPLGCDACEPVPADRGPP